MSNAEKKLQEILAYLKDTTRVFGNEPIDWNHAP